jgi:hypothetical protein
VVFSDQDEVPGFTSSQAHDTASELCVAVASTVAAVAAVLSLRLVPSRTPQMTGVPHAH